ncbi:conserved hypothetical protein [Bradyrhizobium sp. ORS 375]|uniref:hypothetical protein n=1 Tax=Bradyrhizobium sp. (strain ORS 375) TaxID=566679 RepID=UPI0002408AFF|nr:hypothetical protein [Bradyrhizobium sp. ORS 375]CCD92098.1 conserved hypothetical protein [Bradyrhizobium sp. ORS 375]
MTSISASSMSGFSPLDLLKQELTKEVSAGKISATDQTALSSALDDIDSALTSGSGSSSSTSSSTPPSPKEMQSKIDDLIQSEVDSGKLTSDQATELKNVFASAFSGGPGGAGGPPAPPPSDDSSTDTTSSTSSSSSSSQVEELLKKLLEALQSSNSSKTSSYSASGSSSSSSTSKSLVVDFSA